MQLKIWLFSLKTSLKKGFHEKKIFYYKKIIMDYCMCVWVFEQGVACNNNYNSYYTEQQHNSTTTAVAMLRS